LESTEEKRKSGRFFSKKVLKIPYIGYVFGFFRVLFLANLAFRGELLKLWARINERLSIYETNNKPMKFFYLSSKPNSNGEYEVHNQECEHIPDSLDRDYLGPFNNGTEALRKAEKLQPSVTLCKACCSQTLQSIFFKPKNP